jgi:uncharacterized protein (DUF169 family)
MRLDKEIAFCEMLKEAQERDKPFYCTKENENCAGKLALGWMQMETWAESGQQGDAFEIFQDARANMRLSQHFHTFKPGIVEAVAFSRLDQLSFDPDLLILTATPEQAEIVMRAMSYTTGELWQNKATNVLGCSWLYVYPFQSGNVNYLWTGMHFGMKSRRMLPDGYMLISIPYNWIPIITQNLKDMKWVLPAYSLGRDEWMKIEKATFERLDQM